MDSQLIWAMTILSAFMILIMYFRNGIKDPLVMTSVFYFYFAFGPVLNWLFGQPIYHGTIQSQILGATVMFTLGLGAFLIVALAIKPKYELDNRDGNYTVQRSMLLLQIVLFLNTLYALYFLATVAPLLYAGQPKLARIHQIGIERHYRYLSLQFIIFSFFLITAKRARLTQRLFYLNFAVYLAYCLSFGERDLCNAGGFLDTVIREYYRTVEARKHEQETPQVQCRVQVRHSDGGAAWGEEHRADLS